MTLDSTDPAACNRYRIIYGEAARIVEISKMSLARGREHARGVEAEREAILADLGRRYGHYPRDLVELAVDDVLRGRRPRW
jgi:hypothetical protein